MKNNRTSLLPVLSFSRLRAPVWLRLALSLTLLLSIVISSAGRNPVRALTAPTLLSPADFSTITDSDTYPTAIPELRWQAVDGATQYRVQISSDIAFTTFAVNLTTPNPFYISPSVLLADGTWYWRVRVEAPAPVSEYSNVWRFDKQWASPANQPGLLSPADGATIDFYDDPVFSWTPVRGAAKYKIQFYTSSGGWTTLYHNNTTPYTTYQPVTKFANGAYYWRVVPVDAANHDGTPSLEGFFTQSYNPALTLLEPADNSNPVLTPTFRWTAVRGAQFYRLQYSTDPSFGSNVTTIDTRNTAYTPTSTLPNDVNYYWRVRAHSGISISDWTPSHTFIKKWYIQPKLLTPTNSYQDVRFPVFSWTPVPGASYYRVELSLSTGFSPLYDSGTTANTFFTPNRYGSANMTVYWRVTPYDGNGKAGRASDTASYNSYGNAVAPNLVYPLYYYTPDDYPGFSGIATNPHQDRSVAAPIFIWNRVYDTTGNPYSNFYTIQVDDDPLFGSLNWTLTTQNTNAVPDSLHPFAPVTGIEYFWRVCPSNGTLCVGPYSQIWKTRFDPALALTPTAGPAPTLIRPTNGFEFAEATPLLEWFPLSGAVSYDVEISADAGFTTIVDSATVSYPAYIPTESLAQRSLGAVDFGVYYWRARPTGGAWSETRHFQISAQSQWNIRSSGSETSYPLQIGSDAPGDVASENDLTNLMVAQGSSAWFFGFTYPSAANITYALYLDIDHQTGSGATFDAAGYTITADASYRPEYAIYIRRSAGSFSASNVFVYKWNGAGWNTVQLLGNIGGSISTTPTHPNFVEISVPNTAIGYQDTTGSYAISLLSLPSSAPGAPYDSVPSDPNVPGTGAITRFSNVTERINLVLPRNDAGVDPSVFSSVQPFYWDWPVLSPWVGATMKAYLDPMFTTEVATYSLPLIVPFYAMNTHAWDKDFQGDNTYYWRIQPNYGGLLGAWSQGWRFERQGFVPQNLQTSVTFATPTFSWDILEGAEYYDLQVDDDPNFGTPAINVSTRLNSYTDTSTLLKGTYYWHVRAHRYTGIINQWSPTQAFTLSLPVPSGLTPVDGEIASRAPTFCWTPLIQTDGTGTPVLAAWKYRIQVATEPLFSASYDSMDTEQSCWTPTKGYTDRDYYWRVAIMDGNGKLGDYSAPSLIFTKQYPITTLLGPKGATAGTPVFSWLPVDGAAQYRIEVSESPQFSPTYDSSVLYNTRFTPTKLYTTGKTYYWRVQIVDANGIAGPWTNETIILGSRIFIPMVRK